MENLAQRQLVDLLYIVEKCPQLHLFPFFPLLLDSEEQLCAQSTNQRLK